jgi:hypothetical protein
MHPIVLFLCIILIISCNKIPTDKNTMNVGIDYNNAKNNPDYFSKPMNSINISKIILTDLLGNNEEFELNSDIGHYSKNFGKNQIIINYFRRDIEFDSLFMYEHGYDPSFFLEIDKGINDGISEFSHWYFHDNIRKQIINNIILVDSFSFCVNDGGTQLLDRSIFFSTKDHNIMINIFIASEDILKEIYNRIVFEAPEYFTIDFNRPWWKDSNSVVDFGTNLINGNHKSKSVIEWYIETDRILQSLKIE